MRKIIQKLQVRGKQKENISQQYTVPGRLKKEMENNVIHLFIRVFLDHWIRVYDDTKKIKEALLIDVLNANKECSPLKNIDFVAKMDEQKTDDLEEFFDLNQEQAEEDEKNESRNEDVDRGDDVISFSSEESVFFSCDETDEGRTAAEYVATNEDAKQIIKGVLKSNDVTNTVVEYDDANAEANEATAKCVEETRESNIWYTLEVPFNQPRESCWTIVKKNILDCMCCCCTPSSCVACNTRIREQAVSQFVSVPQCCTTHTPGSKVKIAIAPGKTDITPYMASLGIISLEAYMELEAQKKARENVNPTQETKRAEREAEFMQVVEANKNENAEAIGAEPKRVGRMKRIRRFLQRVFCCSRCRED